MIEAITGERSTVVKIAGRIGAGDLAELTAQIDAAGQDVVLDVEEVSLVSVEIVQFLSTCESRGMRLLNCPKLIRTWIDAERLKGPP